MVAEFKNQAPDQPKDPTDFLTNPPEGIDPIEWYKQALGPLPDTDWRRDSTLNDAMTRPLADYERGVQIELEANIIRAIATSKYWRKDLAQIARWNQVPIDEVELIAKRIAKERGLDLDQVEFNAMIRQVKDIEAIADSGFREWRLQATAKQYRRTRRELMEAYNKALIHQSAIAPLTLTEVKQMSAQSTEWTLQGWMPAGVTILIHGHGGTAKTLMLYGIGAAIAKGQPWNDYPTKQGEVLLLQSDEPPHITAERLEAIGITDEDPFRVFPGWQVEKMAQLEEYLRSRFEADSPVRFLIVDSNTSVNRNTLISENDVEYARPILQLADLAQRYGTTIAIVHHSNANGDARGTKAIHNSVSEVWALSIADEMSGDRVLRVQKNRLGRPPGRYKFEFDADTYQFVYRGEESDLEGTAATNEKRIELWLNEAAQRGKAFATEEISHYLRIADGVVRRALLELWAKGIILRKRRTNGRGGGYLYHVGELLSNVKLDRSKETDRVSDRVCESSPKSDTAELDHSIGKSAKISNSPDLKNTNLTDRVIEFGCNPDAEGEMKLDRQLDRTPENADRVQGDRVGDRVPQVGDIVIANATSVWHRHGSDKLPWKAVSKIFRNDPTIPVELMDNDLMYELIDRSKILAIRNDRVRVRNQNTGRTSVFRLIDVKVLEPVEDAL